MGLYNGLLMQMPGADVIDVTGFDTSASAVPAVAGGTSPVTGVTYFLVHLVRDMN